MFRAFWDLAKTQFLVYLIVFYKRMCLGDVLPLEVRSAPSTGLAFQNTQVCMTYSISVLLHICLHVLCITPCIFRIVLIMVDISYILCEYVDIFLA